MELEQIAERFEKVKMNSRGFTARCPAHNDKTPSLTVARGRSGWLVKCQSGCSFFDVVAAAGLRPLDFKFRGSDSLPNGSDTIDKTREVMRDVILESRRIVWQFGELMMITFDLSSTKVAEVLAAYPEFDAVSLPEAMKMHAVLFAGPVADLIGDRYYPNYDSDARRDIEAALWREYRIQQSSLVEH